MLLRWLKLTFLERTTERYHHRLSHGCAAANHSQCFSGSGMPCLYRRADGRGRRAAGCMRTTQHPSSPSSSVAAHPQQSDAAQLAVQESGGGRTERKRRCPKPGRRGRSARKLLIELRGKRALGDRSTNRPTQANRLPLPVSFPVSSIRRAKQAGDLEKEGR